MFKGSLSFVDKPIFPFPKVGQVLFLQRLSPWQCTQGITKFSPQSLPLDFCKIAAHFYWGLQGPTIPLQAYLRWVFDFLPSIIQTSIPPFEQLSYRGIDHFKKNISKNVHEHLFSNIILELFSDCHRIQLRSYVGPCSNVWLFARLIIPSFKMAFDIFTSTLCSELGLPHPQLVIFLDAYVAKPQIRHGYTYVIVLMGESAQSHMMQFKILSPPLLGMLGSMFYPNKHMFSRHHFSCPHNNEWILCLQQMVFALWQTQSLLTRLMSILFRKSLIPGEWL